MENDCLVSVSVCCQRYEKVGQVLNVSSKAKLAHNLNLVKLFDERIKSIFSLLCTFTPVN